MNRFVFTALLALISSSLCAQSRSNIKGKVIDSLDKLPMEMVTVSITDLRDSSFVSYTSTTKTGEFSLKNMPSERPIAIIISMIGYSNFVKVATLKKEETLDLGTIILKIKNNTLSQVVIAAQRQAIVINKDTTEFNVEAFKVRPNAVVEELLKKLPGIQVDNDGTITYNGKSVSKLKIDGKEFLATTQRWLQRILLLSCWIKSKFMMTGKMTPTI